MKKLVIVFLTISAFASGQSAHFPGEGNAETGFNSGYNLEKSPNTKWVLNSVKALESMDTVSYKSFYAADVKFHDNLEDKNLSQNVAFIKALQTNGISVKFDKISPIWEYVHKNNNMKEANNYVISYQYATLTKAGKTVKVVISAVDQIKGGKIVQEWLAYDTAGIMSLFK
jgi:hypothetical protein